MAKANPAREKAIKPQNLAAGIFMIFFRMDSRDL
jgi:hypothetical protein